MKLNEVRPAKGAVRRSFRRGQGPGSGNGKTAGRGNKGQRSRSGSSLRPGFEGGQMPLYRRLPKRGFVNIFRKDYAILNVSDLQRMFPEGGQVGLDALTERGVLHARHAGIKILGSGELTKPMVIQAHKVSKGAQAKIEAAGGRIELLAAPGQETTTE